MDVAREEENKTSGDVHSAEVSLAQKTSPGHKAVTSNSTRGKWKDIMLPTPSTSHVDFERVYEPAEDSYLLLDTLSSENEKSFLASRFTTQNASTSSSPPAPLILEIGTGSGVVLSFIHSNALAIFSRSDILTLGVDVNSFACKATAQTVSVAEEESQNVQGHLNGAEGEKEGLKHGFYLGNVLGDLTGALRGGEVDVLVFNPPYVPTAELPKLPLAGQTKMSTTYEEDSHLLELSYAGGTDGMETTDRLLDSLIVVLSERGVAYVLLCAQNKPVEVIERIRKWGGRWMAESVGSSGMKVGWEKLVVIRIWRDGVSEIDA